MATASINGTTFGYDDEGAGAPLVLIHGHPFVRSMWAPQVTEFTGSGCCRGFHGAAHSAGNAGSHRRCSPPAEFGSSPEFNRARHRFSALDGIEL